MRGTGRYRDSLAQIDLGAAGDDAERYSLVLANPPFAGSLDYESTARDKAETNFVDVVPQRSRLRLSLNLRFHELHDPRGMAKDVTNLGRWGNGDAEVVLSTQEEIPYVMGLVRQAFEKQMGNGEMDS